MLNLWLSLAETFCIGFLAGAFGLTIGLLGEVKLIRVSLKVFLVGTLIKDLWQKAIADCAQYSQSISDLLDSVWKACFSWVCTSFSYASKTFPIFQNKQGLRVLQNKQSQKYSL